MGAQGHRPGPNTRHPEVGPESNRSLARSRIEHKSCARFRRPLGRMAGEARCSACCLRFMERTRKMKVVVDALVYETAMCIDKKVRRNVEEVHLGQKERLGIVLAKMQSSGYAVSQAKEKSIIWLPRKRAFGGRATKHTLEPDTWETTDVDEKQWKAESYALNLQWVYEESAARLVTTTRALFELLNLGDVAIAPKRRGGCRIFALTEVGRKKVYH
jgi:hypothetical protein